MPDEYVIKLTPREKHSLKADSLQQWLVKAEGELSPYWTHTLSNVIEQIHEQNNYKKEKDRPFKLQG